MEEHRVHGTGERLRKIRGGMTQVEFAAMLGIGRTTLLRYESGERQPDVELLLKLNLIFGVQPLWFLAGLGGATTGREMTGRERAIFDAFRAFDEIDKHAIEAVIAAISRKKTGKEP
jgi:transcriptional regulator with XRE-family HTH domain